MRRFPELLGRLIRARVDFVIIGGLAGEVYGVSLATQDIDLSCDFSLENLARLSKALVGLHAYHRMTPKRIPLELTPDFCKHLKNLYLSTDHGQIDLLSSVLGVGDFAEAKRNSIEVELEAGPCRVLSLDALIKAKEAMNRPRDREAVLQLKAIRERLEQDSQA